MARSYGWEKERIDPANLTSILTKVQDGDVLFLDAGDFIEPIEINNRIKLIGVGDEFTNLNGGVAFNVVDAEIENCGIGELVTDRPIETGTVGYKLTKCKVSGVNLQFPSATVRLDDCMLLPNGAFTWILSGVDCLVLAYKCMFGDDLVGIEDKGRPRSGIKATAGAQLYMRFGEMHTGIGVVGTPAIYGEDSARFLLKYIRGTSTLGEAIYLKDDAKAVLDFCYFEGNHADKPTLYAQDDALLRVHNSRIASIVSDYAVQIKSTAIAKFSDVLITGAIVLEAPDAGVQAETHFYGACSQKTEGATPLTDANNKAIGKPITAIEWGVDTFDEDNTTLSLTPTRMIPTAAVLASANKGTVLPAEDADLAVIPGVDQILLTRTGGAPATNNLKVAIIGIWAE